MSAVADITDFLVADLLSFLPDQAQTGAPYVYSGQAQDTEFHENNQHVRVAWERSDPINQPQRIQSHRFQIVIRVAGPDKTNEAIRSKRAREYRDLIVERYNQRPDRFRVASPAGPEILCWKSHCEQDSEIEVGEEDSEERFLVCKLEIEELL